MEHLHLHFMEQERTGLAACQHPPHLQHLQKRSNINFNAVCCWSHV